MVSDFIPYGLHYVDEEDIQAVNEVLRSPWLTTGPVVERFEEALVKKVDASYCVVFNSGTAALHAAYFAAGVQEGDEVITTPLTFMATANAALYLGARPVFVDIAVNSFNIDANKIEEAITPRTKVIAPVDMAGMPAELNEIMNIAERYQLTVVEDGCHALGAVYKGRPVGSIADMTAFSFHPVKHITTGEGGAVTTNNKDFYQQLKIFRSHGVVRDQSLYVGDYQEEENIGFWYYEQQKLGYNYRIPDINCALGLSQLQKLDRFLRRRREIASRYNKTFQTNPHVTIPPLPFGEESLQSSAWHLYVLRLKGESPPRRHLLEALHKLGIGTQVHYIPVYLHPYYRKLGYQPGLCPYAEDYYKRAFSIPLYPAMSDDEVEWVIMGVIKEAEKAYS